MSTYHSFITTRFLAIFLVIACFLLPSLQVVSAAEMEMDHGEMSEDCSDGGCEDTSAQQSCLEHCLQKGVSQSVLFAIVQSQNDTLSLAACRTVFDEPSCEAKKEVPRATGPPNGTDQHLTTQKRE